MVSCPFFTTNFLQVKGELIKHNTKDSFFVYMCVAGEAIIETNSSVEQLKKGETLLMPAAIETYKITSTNATLLEVYV